MNVPLSETLGACDFFPQTWFVAAACLRCARPCTGMQQPIVIIKKEKRMKNTTTEMFGFNRALTALTALLLCYSWFWLSLCVARVSSQEYVWTSVDPAAIVPFFVRRDEGGELVVVVVYGPHDYEKVAVYCRDSIDDVRRRRSSRDLVTQGPGVMQCFRTNREDDEYDLILPFTFVRDDESGVITGVSFADSKGIVVSFRTETDSNGKVMATTFHRTKEATDASSSSSSTSATAAQPEYRIPYTITTSADGTVVAIVYVGDEELTIPLRYVMDSDGSRVVGVSFGPDLAERNIFGGLDASLVGIVVFLVLLACVGLYLTKRKHCHDRRGDYNNNHNNNDDHSRNSLKEGSDSATTITDFDDMETIPVI
jgi:hypothetical protein